NRAVYLSPIAYRGHQTGLARCNVSKDHVRMAVDCFGVRRNYNICAEIERTLSERRGHGVVGNQGGARLTGLGHGLAKIADLETRIGRRLDPHHANSGEVTVVVLGRAASEHLDSGG